MPENLTTPAENNERPPVLPDVVATLSKAALAGAAAEQQPVFTGPAIEEVAAGRSELGGYVVTSAAATMANTKDGQKPNQDRALQDPASGSYALCDGNSGQYGGEAAETAAGAGLAFLREQAPASRTALEDAVLGAVAAARAAWQKTAAGDREKARAATTAAFVKVIEIGRELYAGVGYAGDTAVAFDRDGKRHFVTIPQARIDTPNELTHCIKGKDQPGDDPEDDDKSVTFRVKPGDVILMGTDGVFKLDAGQTTYPEHDGPPARPLLPEQGPMGLAGRLIAQADSRDDKTVQVVVIGESPSLGG